MMNLISPHDNPATTTGDNEFTDLCSADGMSGYDAWKTNPGPAYADMPPPEGEREEFAEPVVEEVWHPARGEYVTTVTFDSGSKFTIIQAASGPFVGDYEIHGPGFFSDGYASPEKAIDWLTDVERWDW